jgi:hypothetical protein
VFLALEARSPCLLCGYLIRLVMCGTARVNKRSMRVRGSLGYWAYRACPECGTPVARASMVPATPYVLTPGDAARVAEYRAKRWGAAA